MKKLLVLLLIVFSIPAFAQNAPCSGKKGGVAYCVGSQFHCQDGSISLSKNKCDPKIFGTKANPKKPPAKKPIVPPKKK